MTYKITAQTFPPCAESTKWSEGDLALLWK